MKLSFTSKVKVRHLLNTVKTKHEWSFHINEVYIITRSDYYQREFVPVFIQPFMMESTPTRSSANLHDTESSQDERRPEGSNQPTSQQKTVCATAVGYDAGI